jgi:hypothetical protein
LPPGAPSPAALNAGPAAAESRTDASGRGGRVDLHRSEHGKLEMTPVTAAVTLHDMSTREVYQALGFIY